MIPKDFCHPLQEGQNLVFHLRTSMPQINPYLRLKLRRENASTTSLTTNKLPRSENMLLSMGLQDAAHFSKELDKPVSESTVRSIRDRHKRRVLKVKRNTVSTDKYVKFAESTLPKENRGRPLLLGKSIQNYLKPIREAGGVINTSITIAGSKGIIESSNPGLLIENGGSVLLTKSWAASLLNRMGYARRKATTSARTLPENFSTIKYEFLNRITTNAVQHNIPDELILNFDQTGLKFVPCGEWTMKQKGSKRVEIAGLSDKRMITAVVASTLSGDMLPVQLIYDGKTDRCHPQGVKFLSDWNITHSDNHWSTNKTMEEYADIILIPYVNRVKKEQKLPKCQKSLVILDMFKCHQDRAFQDKFKKAHINLIFVPPNCTSTSSLSHLTAHQPRLCPT